MTMPMLRRGSQKVSIRTWKVLLRVFVCSTALLGQVNAFGIIEPSALHEAVTFASSNAHAHVTSAADFLPSILSSSSSSSSDILASSDPMDLLESYKQSLANHPLITKMLTGATLAVCGDAIAQSQTKDEPYDQRRAASFAAFDSVYRAVQHFSFPAIVEQCQGQYIGALVALLPLHDVASAVSDSSSSSAYYFGAMEQTLVSQLGIVPFFYYPVFYTVTAFVQGLDSDAALQRAKDTFIPLMKRNLLFWIPIQFIQFGYVDESLQIPFLSVAGLMWTFIISVFAGNAKNAAPANATAATEMSVDLEKNVDPSELMVDMDVDDRATLIQIEQEIIRTALKEEKMKQYSDPVAATSTAVRDEEKVIVKSP